MSDAVLIAICAALPPTLTALAALLVTIRAKRQIDRVEQQTNSITTQLVASTAREARAEGVAAVLAVLPAAVPPPPAQPPAAPHQPG